jgi:DNA polymerase III subunit epsilon
MITHNTASGVSAVARLMADADDQRICLSRVRPLDEWPVLADPILPIRTIAVVDTETEGLDPRLHQVIEIAVAFAETDAHGRIVRVTGKGQSFNNPGRPLSPQIRDLTGLTDAMLAGQRVNVAHVAKRLNAVDIIVAHNCAHDRPFAEALLPDLQDKPWVCSLNNAAWQAWGFDGRKQDHLLMQSGLFNPTKHRALADVASLMALLNVVTPTGRSVLTECIDHAKKPTWLFRAEGLPFEYRQRIKDRGWRWLAAEKVWWAEVPHADRAAEEQWYDQAFRPFRDKPVIKKVTWTTRYKH